MASTYGQNQIFVPLLLQSNTLADIWDALPLPLLELIITMVNLLLFIMTGILITNE